MRLFAFLIEENLKDERGSDGIDFILFLGSGCLHCLERIFGGDRRESLVLSSDFDIGCNGFDLDKKRCKKAFVRLIAAPSEPSNSRGQPTTMRVEPC